MYYHGDGLTATVRNQPCYLSRASTVAPALHLSRTRTATYTHVVDVYGMSKLQDRVVLVGLGYGVLLPKGSVFIRHLVSSEVRRVQESQPSRNIFWLFSRTAS